MDFIKFKLVWFDSLGAKSACTLVQTPDVSVLIDPGAAVMHPSFPASWPEKFQWLKDAKQTIRQESRRADVIIISHYHFDHFSPKDLEIYNNKTLLVKDPNEYINDSQRGRAERFYGDLCRTYGKVELEDILREKEEKEFLDPMCGLSLAKARDFGDYTKRKQTLLEKGRKWFYNRVARWKKSRGIPEFKFKKVKVKFADGKEFRFGKTRLGFTEPLFHGVEYSRVGWVFATVIEYEKERFIHSSDLNGPVIEDYASWIINQNPDILILDGPMTYMFGYLLNRINLGRAVENACEIVRQTNTKLIIYDHHLPREARFRERVKRVYEVSEGVNKKVLTAAEHLGTKPRVFGVG